MTEPEIRYKTLQRMREEEADDMGNRRLIADRLLMFPNSGNTFDARALAAETVRLRRALTAAYGDEDDWREQAKPLVDDPPESTNDET